VSKLTEFLEDERFERLERRDKTIHTGQTIPWFEARAHHQARGDLPICGYGETAADAIADCRHKLRLVNQWTSDR